MAWIVNYCDGASVSLAQQLEFNAPGDYLDICTVPNMTPCSSNVYSTDRALLTAGDDDRSLKTAQVAFEPAELSASTVRSVINAAFTKCSAGVCSASCSARGGGYLCDGPVSLVAVPGLLLKAIRGMRRSCRAPLPCI